MICHRHLADRLSFIGLTAVCFSLFLVDCRIKSIGTLAYPKVSFGPALELSRFSRPRVFHQQALVTLHNFSAHFTPQTIEDGSPNSVTIFFDLYI